MNVRTAPARAVYSMLIAPMDAQRAGRAPGGAIALVETMKQTHDGSPEKQRLEIDGGPYGTLVYDGPPIAGTAMSPRDATRANIKYWRKYDPKLRGAREKLLKLVETDLAGACLMLRAFRDQELDEAERIRDAILWRYKFDILTQTGYGADFRVDPEVKQAVAGFITVYGQKIAIANAVVAATTGYSGTIEGDRVRAGINGYFDAYEKWPGSFGVAIDTPLYPGQVAASTYNVAGWIGASTSLEVDQETGKRHAPRLYAAMKQDDANPDLSFADQLPGATFEAWRASDTFDPEGVRRAVRRTLERKNQDPDTTVPFTDMQASELPRAEEFAARDEARDKERAQRALADFAELRIRAGLTKTQDRILELHLQDLPYKDIANKLGPTTTENSVKQQVFQIKTKLRAAAGDDA